MAFRPRFVFFETPAAWWIPRIDGRWFTDSEGGLTALRDLSVLMLGDVARRAALECLDGPEVRSVAQLKFGFERESV